MEASLAHLWALAFRLAGFFRFYVRGAIPAVLPVTPATVWQAGPTLSGHDRLFPAHPERTAAKAL